MEKLNVVKALLPAFTKKAAREGYTSEALLNEQRLAIFLKNGEYAFNVWQNGEIHYNPNTPYSEEILKLTDVYLEMMESYGIFMNAKPLPMNDLSNYKLLSEHGNYLLAARMEPDKSLHFVTWRYDFDHKGVIWGNYFDDNYTAAKQDYAIRAGLIHKDKLFTNEELVVLYDACAFRGKNDEEISFEDEKKLQSVLEKIESNITDLLFDSREQESESSMER